MIKGGIIRGKAAGNHLNMADYKQNSDSEAIPGWSQPSMGKIHFYISDKNPNEIKFGQTEPAMTAKSAVTDSIAPVLRTLAELYSPLKSMFIF